MSGSKCKSSDGVAGTAKKRKERQEEEEVTEEPKRFTMQEMQGDFLYLRRHC